MEYKAIGLSQNSFSSVPAPDEWRKIPEIAKAKPIIRNCEISLKTLDIPPLKIGDHSFCICVWEIGRNGIWKEASEYFIVYRKD